MKVTCCGEVYDYSITKNQLSLWSLSLLGDIYVRSMTIYEHCQPTKQTKSTNFHLTDNVLHSLWHESADSVRGWLENK